MHLLRQTDFVYVDGERITDFVYPIEALSEMTRDISERFSFPLELRKRSKSTEAPLSGPMSALQKGLARVSRATMPAALTSGCASAYAASTVVGR